MQRMTGTVRVFFVVMLLLCVYNLAAFARGGAPSDAIAALGFGMMAWLWWRNPRGIKDEYGVDHTQDRRALKVGIVGAALIIGTLFWDMGASLLATAR